MLEHGDVCQPGPRADDLQGVRTPLQHGSSAQQPGIADSQGVCRSLRRQPRRQFARRHQGVQRGGSAPAPPGFSAWCAPGWRRKRKTGRAPGPDPPAVRRSASALRLLPSPGAPGYPPRGRLEGSNEQRSQEGPGSDPMILGREIILRSGDKNGVLTSSWRPTQSPSRIWRMSSREVCHWRTTILGLRENGRYRARTCDLQRVMLAR